MKFSLSRNKTINKPLSEVRPLIADFNNWQQWSPWSIIEPGHGLQVSGSPGEVGHTMEWDGKVIGAGKNTIKSVTDTEVTYNLDFLSPYKSSSVTAFTFSEENGATTVTWSMETSMPWFLFLMIPMMKSWIEMDYDRGLTMLKAVAEAGGVNATTSNEGIVDFEGFSYVGLEKTSTMDDMPTEMEALFYRLKNEYGMEAKHWVSIYPKVNMKTKMFTYISAASDECDTSRLGNDYLKGSIKSSKMLKITHRGSYEFLGNAWSMGMMHFRALKLKKAGPPFEYYHNGPHDTAPEDLITDIYFPIK